MLSSEDVCPVKKRKARQRFQVYDGHICGLISREMKNRLVILFISLLAGAGCKKAAPGKTSEVSGYLRYSNPAWDGVGFTYTIDSSHEIILSDDFQKTSFAAFINVHSILRFIDQGQQACLPGMAAGCPVKVREVKVVNLW
jgi:hypothetical protein